MRLRPVPTTRCVVSLLLGLWLLNGCERNPAPQFIVPAQVSGAQAFYDFVVAHYQAEEKALIQESRVKSRSSPEYWDVSLRLVEIRLKDARQAEVFYMITSLWTRGAWGGEIRTPILAIWKQIDGTWRLIHTQEGRSITNKWGPLGA